MAAEVFVTRSIQRRVNAVTAIVIAAPSEAGGEERQPFASDALEVHHDAGDRRDEQQHQVTQQRAGARRAAPRAGSPRSTRAPNSSSMPTSGPGTRQRKRLHEHLADELEDEQDGEGVDHGKSEKKDEAGIM